MKEYEKRVLHWECPSCRFKLSKEDYHFFSKNAKCPGYAGEDCTIKLKDYYPIVISVPKYWRL